MSTSTKSPRVSVPAVPKGMTAARHSIVLATVATLADTLTAFGAASDKLAAKHGAGVTPAAVRLAKRAADVYSDDDKREKLRGGARADVLAVLAKLSDTPGDIADGDRYSARSFALAAAARLASNSAAAAARQKTKRALAKQVNDAKSSPAARSNALDVLAGMDGADNDAKRAAVTKRFGDVLEAALKLGIPADVLASNLAAAYGVTVAVDYPAAVVTPADDMATAAA
jgi:hypothetical protein